MPSEAEWERFFHPKEALSKLGLREGMVFADLGCGYGTFTVAGAKIVGQKGLVYALDIGREMVRRVKKRTEKEGLRNVKAMLGDMTSPGGLRIPPASTDFALLANVLHGTKAKVRLLKQVKRILRRGGKIVILNWDIAETPRGPPMPMRLKPFETATYLVRAGFSSPKVRRIPPYHHAVIGRVSSV